MTGIGIKKRVRRRVAHARFPGSSEYWEQRYAAGGNSGAGSYGEIAKFKAEVLNHFVAEKAVESVIEFGCGDGHQLSLATYPRYLGLDVSRTAVRTCIERFGDDETKSFAYYEPHLFLNCGAITADVALSLDVIEHLVEDELLITYLADMSAAASRFLIFFTEDQKANPGAAHVRYRNVADWSPMLPGWRLTGKIDNPLKGADTQADFFIFTRS
jgi:hypothetical protein